MKYISSLSGGVASAVAHNRAIERYGKKNVTPWFADTLYEDEDLYRFLGDLENYWNQKIIRQSQGMTPPQVAEREKMIFNNRHAYCSRVLKIEPFTVLVKACPKPVTILLGLDWTEEHRMVAPKKNYERIDGVTVDFPLMWKPLDFDMFQTVKSWGIKIPKLYKMGFPHNNCGGRCFRQGISEWLRLRVHFPERFEEVKDWETAQQNIGDARKSHAICKDQSGNKNIPLSLRNIEKRKLDDNKSNQEDMFACFCSY